MPKNQFQKFGISRCGDTGICIKKKKISPRDSDKFILVPLLVETQIKR